MHPSIRSLLDLDDVNRQRQILVKQRTEREARLKKARDKYEALQAKADAAGGEAGNNDALIRQYEGDIKRCDETVEKLRTQQLEASTNKAYVACLNGIETAKAEKKVREESLLQLGEKVEELQAVAKAAQDVADAAKAEVDAIEAEATENTDADVSEAELERIYEEKKTACDPKFLEIYERLVKARHPRPLMRVDPRTRATPLGNCISTNALESLRLGNLVTDQDSSAILYVDEEEKTKVEKAE